tara:strand:- start:571 stop:729 length:159 start_codon:yes stop_codon:yes gene_type:complete
MSSGKLPAKLYKACCELAAEHDLAPPPLCLFSFSKLSPSQDEKSPFSAEDAA